MIQLQQVAGNRAVSHLVENEVIPVDPSRSMQAIVQGQQLVTPQFMHVVQLQPQAKATNTTLHIDEDPPYCCEEGKKVLANLKNLPSPDDAPAYSKETYANTLQGDSPEDFSFTVSGQKPDGTEGPKNTANGKLAHEAIGDLEEMLKAASAAGVTINVHKRQTQRDLGNQWRVWHGAKPNHPTSGQFVALPGRSNHGTGRAIDFGAGYDWLLANAGNYGWVNLPTERWHYDHVSTKGIFAKNRRMVEKGTNRKQVSGGSASPLTDTEKQALLSQYEDAMVFVAVPWNQSRNYSRDTWLKVQEAIGMPAKDRTGTVDAQTVRAVIDWQKKQPKTELDGKVGPKMLKALGITSSSNPAPPPAVKTGASSTASQPTPAPVKHYSLKNPKIILSAKAEKKIAQIADAYFQKTQKNIVVTDGTRTAAEQADRMYTKLKLGDDIVALYRKNKDTAKAIKKIYETMSAAKKPAGQIKASMTAVIEEQSKKGIYLSKHLREGAVDVRNRDMTASEKKTFIEVAKAHGVSVLVEAKPPHLHLNVN